MGYRYRNASAILKDLDPALLPMVGPALCDLAEGDPEYDIPRDLAGYYVPYARKKLGSARAPYPVFFGELQPETHWLDQSGKLNASNLWPTGTPAASPDMKFGLHLPLAGAFCGSTSHSEQRSTVNIRKKVIDFGERIGVSYYVIHLTQDGYTGTDDNYRSVKQIFFETLGYLAAKKTKAYVLLENLEYPKYPATPQELAWWYGRAVEAAGNSLKLGIVMDVAHLWKTRGDLMRGFAEHKRFPDWIEEERDIISQPYHDLLNYTLKTKLAGAPVITFHLGGCYGHETHLVPGMRVDDDPDTAEIRINRFYDENVEMNLKSTVKNIVQYYFDSFRGLKIGKTGLRPLYIVTESYISMSSGRKRSLKFPAVMSGVRAVRDYLVQYMEKLYEKSENRVRVYDLLKGGK